MIRQIAFVIIILAALQGQTALSLSKATADSTSWPRIAERTILDPVWSTPVIVSGRFQTDQALSKEAAAVAFFDQRHVSFRLARPDAELELVSEFTDRLGMTHLRFNQTYRGLRVWGCQTVVHFDDHGDIYLVGGQTIPTPSLSTAYTVTAAEAGARALADLKEKLPVTEITTTPELLVYPDAGKTYLAWLVTVEGTPSVPCRWLVFVEAQTAEILHKYDDLQSDGPAVGSGPDVNDSTRTLQTYFLAGKYQMIDASRLMYVPPIDNFQGLIVSYMPIFHSGRIVTDPDGDNIFDDYDSLKAAVSGHYYTGITYEYFLNTFGRNSYDGNGHNLYMVAHDTTEVNNAFWYGNGRMCFGGGDGVNYLPWSGALDVVAHELTHGVTSTTAGLIYQFQSGALSESYSDFFGCMVDRDDWTNCEEIRLTPPGFLRNLADPHQGVDPDRFPFGYQPAHMSEYVYAGIENDNGGVHINSGIPNKAGYLTATAIGREKAEQIWFRTLTVYLTPASSFYFWADMTTRAAEDLYGEQSPEVAAVEAALDSVGIGDLYCSPDFIPNFGVTVGSTAETTFKIHNRSVDTLVVLSAATAAGYVQVTSPFPKTLYGRDSIAVSLFVDATSAGVCDIGAESDTVFITTTSLSSPTLKVPVTVITALGSGALSGTYLDDRCVTLLVANNMQLQNFWHYCENPEGCLTGLFQGSPLVGMVDGGDTVVYHTYGEGYPYPFPPVGQFSEGTLFDSYRFARCVFSSPDARIQGLVKFYYDFDGNAGCEYVLADYIFTNPCDTPLTVLTGMMCDFDLGTSTSNYSGYDSLNRLSWVRDAVDVEATAIMFLSGAPQNLRVLHNPTQVWPYGTLPANIAYREMAQGNNLAGASADDWSTLVTFGTDTIGPGDTVQYRAAFLYSAAGVAGLAKLVAAIRPPVDSGSIYADPWRIRQYHGAQNPTNPPDTFLVVDYVGSPPVPWQAEHLAPWLQLDRLSGLSSDTIGLSFNLSGLTPGQYLDTIKVHSDQARYGDWNTVIDLKVIAGDGVIAVPAEQPNIQAAINAAVDGEKILVSPGTYKTNLDFKGKEIKLVGIAGSSQTTLQVNKTDSVLIRIDKGEGDWTEISGFTITGQGLKQTILIGNGAMPLIANNFFSQNGAHDRRPNIIESWGGVPYVIGNLFVNNPNAYVCIIPGEANGIRGSAFILNNTIDRCHSGIGLNGGRGTAKYNIVTNSEYAGIGTNGRIVACNNSWHNEVDYWIPPQGSLDPSNISTDPRYCDPVHRNYELTSTSPCAPANSPCGKLIGAFPAACTYLCGDADHSEDADISDAVYVIAYIFAGGPPPAPLDAGDADCSSDVDISDVVYLIAYIFAGGPAPCEGC